MDSALNQDLPSSFQRIDARGHRCPVPTLKLRRVAETTEAAVVELLADDPMAQIDVPHFCTQNGYLLLSAERRDAYWVFQVRCKAASGYGSGDAGGYE